MITVTWHESVKNRRSGVLSRFRDFRDYAFRLDAWVLRTRRSWNKYFATNVRLSTNIETFLSNFQFHKALKALCAHGTEQSIFSSFGIPNAHVLIRCFTGRLWASCAKKNNFFCDTLLTTANSAASGEHKVLPKWTCWWARVVREWVTANNAARNSFIMVGKWYFPLHRFLY